MRRNLSVPSAQCPVPGALSRSASFGAVRILCLLWGMMMVFASSPLMAQFPGEVTGTVTDAATGAPVEAASIELTGAGGSPGAARTDAAGAFRVRGLEPGEYRVSVRRAGYAPREVSVAVRNGAAARLDVALQPVAVALQALRVTAEAPDAAATIVDRAQIEASGARTAADVVERAGGVVVRATGPTGERTASIRGSAAEEVLVLVDGAPLNDPVTGQADLSAVPAAEVERVTVLPGARTARYGPRAQAGVVLIETRAARPRQAAELSAGSLGEWSGRGEAGTAVGRGAWTAGAQLRRIGGGFRYLRDVNDPTVVRRSNDDLDEWSVFSAFSSTLAGGELRLRGGWDALDRGLPGLGHTPSTQAREEMGRGRGSLSWRHAGRRTTVSLAASGAAQRVRFSDPAPPFGVAYDDTTRVRTGIARFDADRLIDGAGPLRSVVGGVEAGVQRVEAGSLSTSAPRTRHDFGAFGHAGGGFTLGGREVSLSAEARADRDGVTGEWFVSRALSAGAAFGPVRVQLANRSAFTPPSLGDQFFREGVGVVPNPDLRPERVPNEWEASAQYAQTVGQVGLSAAVSAYAGDVKGMIVWLPDFAFRWSPRNLDVTRRGADARAEVGLPAAGLRVSGAWSVARVTWVRDGEDTGIQAVYRPEHSGRLAAEWAPGPWRAELAARYTGLRYPVPDRANALPGFWSAGLDVSRRWRLGRWDAVAAVDVDRLFDEKQSLIAGYPEPGRRIRFDLRLSRAGFHQP